MGKDARGAQRVEKLWLKRETERRAKKAKASARRPPMTQGGPGIGLIGKKGRPGVRY